LTSNNRFGRVVYGLWVRVRTARLPLRSNAGPSRAQTLRAFGLTVVLAIAGILACKLLLPRGLPNSIVLLGLEIGGLNALAAGAIVLVYRANRVVNFAQGDLGAFAASLAFMLMLTLHWSWFAAVPVALLAATAVGALVEFGIIRRFFDSPRLIMTVATIGIAQVLVALRLGLPGFFPRIGANPGSFPSPFSRAAFHLDVLSYTWDDVLIIVAVPLVTLFLLTYLRGTWAGLGTRVAAENADRSRLLGIRIRRLSTIVWAIAGFLSGLTALLAAPTQGFSLGTVSGSSLLIRALAPAAVGGFESLPVTLIAALALGVVEQAFFWNFSRGGPLVTLLLGVLLVALLIRARSQRTITTESSSWSAVRDVRRVPRKVRALLEYRAATAFFGLVALGLVVAFPTFMQPGQLNMLGLVGVHVIAGLSLVVLTGWIGQVSLGQWALVGVGAFFAGNASSRWNLDFFATILIGALLAGVVALLLGIPAQRMPGMLFGVTTLAFAVAAENWLFGLPVIAERATPERPLLFGALDISGSSAYYYVMLFGVLAAIIAARNMKRYRLADSFLAVRDNPAAAEAFTISVTRARRLAFFLSGCLAGYAGVLYAFHQGVVDSARFPADQGVALLSIVVIGGLGSISGVVLGAVIVRTAQYLLPAWVAFFGTGVGLLIVLLVFPGGIGEVIFRVRYRMAAWLGRRRGVIVAPESVSHHEHIGEPIMDEART
jgi:branched-chain amino acid transport system permease protein